MSKFIFKPNKPSKHLELMLSVVSDDFIDITNASSLQNTKLVFAIDLDELGLNIEVLQFLQSLKKNSLEGSNAMILIATPNELYSKSFAQQLIFLLNNLGCSFVGRPMVEAIEDLKNMITPSKVNNCSREEALLKKCKSLYNRFINYKVVKKDHPKLLVVHSSNKATSNTLKLWNLVQSHLDYEISEIHIENNEIKDCNGCSYDVCSYFGKTNSCIYKGKIIDEVFPKLLECDALVVLSPNYNDSVSAQLVAFINRLSSLFTQHDFYDKTLFSVVVSGFSGSDCLARQLISAISVNKQFRLPPRFCLSQIANEKGSLMLNDDVEKIAEAFALNIKNNL